MAFKSTSQKQRMAQLVKDGKLDQKVFDAFHADTPPDEVLPERTTWQKALQIKSVKILRAQKVKKS